MTALEKDREWPWKNHEDDILMHPSLNNLAMAGHIQHDLPLLIAVVEQWDLDTNYFHLPLGEIIVTLLDIYRIWGIPIWVQLVHQVDIEDNNDRQQYSVWLIGEEDHD